MSKEIPYVETAAWLGAEKLCGRTFAVRATPQEWKNLGFNSKFWFQNSEDNTVLWLSPHEQENWLSRKFGTRTASDLISAEVGILYHPDEMNTISSHETKCVIDNEMLRVPVPKGVLVRDVKSKRNASKKIHDYMKTEENWAKHQASQDKFDREMGRGMDHKPDKVQTQKAMTPSEWWEAVQTVIIGIEQDVGNADILLDVLVKMQIK